MNRRFAFIAVLCFALGAFATEPAAPAPLLPQSFAGWEKTQTLKDRTIPFDDVDVAAQAISALTQGARQ